MFDLIIIGGGPGGYHLAQEAAKEKMQVALIEKDKLGGTCLNVGCIPSKAFLHIEKIMLDANESHKIGIKGTKLGIDQKKVVAYKNDKVKQLVAGVKAKVAGAGAKIFNGHGKILKPKTPGVFEVAIDDKEILQGKRLVIATGSKVFVPPFIKGVEELYKKGKVITSTEALDQESIPKEMVVIGGGIIGLELGGYFASAGSKVSVIEATNKLAGAVDKEITTMFQEVIEKKGMKIHLNSKVFKVDEKKVHFTNEKGEEKAISYDKVLVSVGRKANLDNLGIENLNLATHHNGIEVDDKLQTNVANVFAIGDANGKMMLAHTAYKHAEIVMDNLLGKNVKMDYNKVPSVVYGTPEIAEIGINEDKAKAEGYDVIIKKIPMLYSGKFLIENVDYSGLIKMIIKKSNQEIIGMSIFGLAASEIIHSASIIVGLRFNIEQIRSLIFSHPTIGEIIKDVALS